MCAAPIILKNSPMSLIYTPNGLYQIYMYTERNNLGILEFIVNTS